MTTTLENYGSKNTILVCSKCKKESTDSDYCNYCGKPLVLIVKCNGVHRNE